MSIAACAALVQRGDPERFRATMAAPVWAREKLFPIYAFNLEAARAPWVTAEPLIAEMRLQWWADALDEIAGGGPVRRHEVATPLAEALDPEGAALLARVVEARRLDIGNGPEDGESFLDYLAETGGPLMRAAGRALGAPEEDEAPLYRLGYGLAHANWLRAFPALVAAGRRPLYRDAPQLLPILAEEGLKQIDLPRLSKPARIAALAAWQARTVLRRAKANEKAITEGRLDPSPARSHLTLMLAVSRA